MRKSQRDLELHIASVNKLNLEDVFGYVRKKKVMTSSIGLLTLENSECTNDDTKIAERLNDYLAFVFTVEDMNGFEEIRCR